MKNLINLLKSGSVAEKQAAVLKLDELHNSDDADILMSNLTDCDGKIREAVSFRLAEFIRKNPEYFTKHSDIFIKKNKCSKKGDRMKGCKIVNRTRGEKNARL